MTLRFTSTSNIKFRYTSNVPRSVFVNEANCDFMTFVMWRPWHLTLGDFPLFRYTKVCLKKHSCNLHAPLCGIFRPNSVAVARYGALIQAKSPTNSDVHLAERLFQTRSKLMIQLLYGENPKEEKRVHKHCSNRKSGKKIWGPGGTWSPEPEYFGRRDFWSSWSQRLRKDYRYQLYAFSSQIG